MARQTTVRLTDDLDGSDAQTTVRFGWEGVGYEIDLTSEHAEAFTAAVRPYLEAARRVVPERRARRNATTGRSSARSGRSVGEQAVIREWARDHGFELADRGRIPRRVLDAYQAGQQNDAPSAGSDPAPTTNRTRSAPARQAASRKRAAAKATKRATAKKATVKKTSARKTAAKTTATTKVAANKTAAKKATRRARATVKAS